MRSLLSVTAKRPVVALIALLTLAGCGPPKAAEPTAVGTAWQRSDSAAQRARRDGAAGGRNDDRQAPIATVNGRPLPRHRLVNLLLRSHGVGVLEQLIVLDAAEQLAADRGIRITEADVDHEYEQALRQLVNPLGSMGSGPFDRAAAERTLEAVLSDRNISREEFLLGMKRHAYLRRLVKADQRFTEEQLRSEFRRQFGPRVQVRHIQLASPREMARVRSRLAAGEPFGEVARRSSANLVSAETGGLLDPFSPEDDALPLLFRTTAAALQPGEVSEAVRIGEWYHVIKLERRIDAQDVDFEAVRDDLTRTLPDRLAAPAMQSLYEKLFREAQVEIHDPALRDTFQRVHPPKDH